MRVPVNYIILEGTDLSGKTTLYNGIHRSTGFEWNIQDRSALSMLCYARQYGRDPLRWREQLREEINHLNNRIVVLMPDRDTILRRLEERGDEFQDAKTIVDLRDIFEEEVSRIEKFPNVLVIRTPMPQQDLVDHTVRWVRSTVDRTTRQVASDVWDHASASGGESFRLTADIDLGTGFHDRNPSCLEVEEERAYYARIREAFVRKIKCERVGMNEHGSPQREGSRRFIHAENTCISMIHAMVRNQRMHFSATLRSSNVATTLVHDIDFLYLLAEDAHREIGVSPVLESVMHLSIQSAHLVP